MNLGFVLHSMGLALAGILALAGAEAPAQSVPVASRNVAGYIKLTVARNGLYQIHYPLMALDRPAVTVNDIMSHLPNGSSVAFWDAAGQTYLAGNAAEVKLLGAWQPGTNNLIGKTFWLQVGHSATPAFDIYLTGEVPDRRSLPTATVLLAGCGPNSLNLVGYAYPMETRWTNTAFASSAANGSSMMMYDSETGQYQSTVKSSGSWSRDLVLLPGQAFWLHTGSPTNWVETKPYIYP